MCIYMYIYAYTYVHWNMSFHGNQIGDMVAILLVFPGRYGTNFTTMKRSFGIPNGIDLKLAMTGKKHTYQN